MTAPAAPSIRVFSDGQALAVRWRPVPDATDYKLYVGSTTAPTGLEADIADDDMGSDGWFVYHFLPEDTDSYLRLTALNAGAEESGYSNEVRFQTSNAGTHFGFTGRQPFGG